MSYIDIENTLIDLMDGYPEGIRKSGDFDAVFLVFDVAKEYELTYKEIEGLLEETYLFLTGKNSTEFLAKRIQGYLDPETEADAEKVAKSLILRVFEPIREMLGARFPLHASSELSSDKSKSEDAQTEEETPDRETILRGIESPEANTPRQSFIPSKRTDLSALAESHLALSGMPGELKHTLSAPIPAPVKPKPSVTETNPALKRPLSSHFPPVNPPEPDLSKLIIQKVKETTPQNPPQKVGSIIEQKMNSMTSLPKKEGISTSSGKPQQTYTVDPYRESPK